MLAPLAVKRAGSGRAAPKFRVAGRKTCLKELKCLEGQARKLAKLSKNPDQQRARKNAAKMLADTIQNLHKPTIVALADAGFLGGARIKLEKRMGRLAKSKAAPGKAPIRLLELVADRAKLAKVSDMPNVDRVRRPTNNLATGVVRILHGAFESLTGEPPAITVRSDKARSRASGYFFNLVRDVFAALNIKVSPEAYTRAVLKAQKAKRLKKI